MKGYPEMTSTPEDSTREFNESSQPVVMITNEYMSKRRKEGIERDGKAAPEAEIFVSPLNCESVQGYPTDKTPKQNGASEIKEMTDCLLAAGILCCLVGEAALMYYGARRVLPVQFPDSGLRWGTGFLTPCLGLEIMRPQSKIRARGIRSIGSN